MNGRLVARGLADGYFSVPQPDPVIDAIATSIDYEDGGEVQHATIQYLAERARFEDDQSETIALIVRAALGAEVEIPAGATAAVSRSARGLEEGR